LPRPGRCAVRGARTTTRLGAIAWAPLALAPILFIAATVDAALLANPLADGGWWAWPAAFAAHGSCCDSPRGSGRAQSRT
jgi:hypothetical protein